MAEYETIVAPGLAGEERYIAKVCFRTRKGGHRGTRKVYLTLNDGVLFKDYDLVQKGAWLSIRRDGAHRVDVDVLRFDEEGRGHVTGTITLEPLKKGEEAARG